MRHAYIDCFSGVSGDMLLGAFVGAGWSRQELSSIPEKMGLSGTLVEVKPVRRQGVEGLKIGIRVEGPQPLRRLRDIEDVLEKASLSSKVTEWSRHVFRTIAEAEAVVHGCRPDEVHFHEIGAVDTLLDVVGTISAIADLEIETVTCSPVPFSRGWVRSGHGRLPLPAPASAELLRGIPVYGIEASGELATPTGLALLKTVTGTFGPMPQMTVESVGYGAGARDDPDRPNLLRVWLGHLEDESLSRVVELRTTIDDMNPEWYGFLMERLFRAGALDVSLTPVQMKKNRPGTEIMVISPTGMEENLSRVLFEESTTSGVRLFPCSRYLLPRRSGKVPTPWGYVKAKMIIRPEGRRVITPEYEACRQTALREGLPLSEIYRTAGQAGPDDFIEADETIGNEKS